MKTKHILRRGITSLTILGFSAITLMGCPATFEYDLGFDVGFLEDDWYWSGFDDSYDTVDAGIIYYQGGDIPYIEDLSYDAGYWDGIWYAYNDGYFVAYDYAFVLGFSEGYIAAFAHDGADFIQTDTHLEYLDGGFSDGYNDGFSEGRVFGAWEYEEGWASDWLAALLDYQSGVDVTVGAVSTGLDGPVYLYEYGTDPNDLFLKSAVKRPARPARNMQTPSIRKFNLNKQSDAPAISYRTLIADEAVKFNVQPATTDRGSRSLTALTTTWLDRIEAYNAAYGGTTKHIVKSRN